MIELSPAQLQRFRFLEARLLWEGALRRKDLCSAFGLTPNHVTREIGCYRDRYPGNLLYDTEARAWRATERFQPRHASGDAKEYLELLLAFSLAGDPAIMVGTGPAVPVEMLPEMEGSVSADVLRPLVAAIGQQQGVEIVYQSFSKTTPQRRIIWPRTLVYVLSRWHVRAYDERRVRFADFVVNRIIQCSPPKGPADLRTASQNDIEWLQSIEVAVQPAPHLSASQQSVVAKQFGMRQTDAGWRWSAKVRQCMVKYFLHQHRLDLPTESGARARIVLCDPAIAENHAFSDD
ncbi:WYL domain-containing protein [Castellaniella sp.]|uniref:WYL domain-containing protein n=1 Tax=Castellaniella sp. TaxID=1955812 RepID=UPI002AFDD674|nr:WYL domain-containing protein [Castellaniella sp.]